MGYYKDLTAEERAKVTSAYVGLKLNKGKEGITQNEAAGAIRSALGRPPELSDYRDPAINQIFSLIKRKKRI